MKLLNWIYHEVNIQIKNGLYLVYIVVNLIYIFLLGYIPEEHINVAITFIIYSDPTMLGMIFVGAFVLLEKRSNVIKGLGVTSLSAWEYVLGKVISMWLISVVTSFFIAIFYKGMEFDFLLLLVTISISSAIFTMIGIICSAYSKSMNHYLGIVALFSIFLSLPVLNYVGFNIDILNLFPMVNAINSIYASITNSEFLVFNIVCLCLWGVITMIITENIVDHKLFRG